MPSQKYDDTYPGIQYFGAWRIGGVAAEYQRTTHVAEKAGSRLSIIFEGTSIGVYGTITLSEAISQYSIDNASPLIFQAPSRSSTEYGKLFYQSPILSDGEHTLVVTSLSDNTFYLDFLTIAVEETSPSASTSTPQNTTQTVTEKAVIPTLFTTTLLSSSPPASLPNFNPSNIGSNTDQLGPPMGLTSDSPSSPTIAINHITSMNTTLHNPQLYSTPTSGLQTPTQLPNAINFPPSDSQPSNRILIGAIIGGAIAGALIISCVIAFFWRYRQRSVKHAVLPISRVRRSRNGSFASLFGSPVDERRPPQDGEIIPFVDTSSLSGPRNIQDADLMTSTLNNGHVRKSSYHSSPTTTYAPPMTFLVLDLGARSLFPGGPLGTTNDPAPPAYRRTFEIPEV
ncbi:hypothetical protein BDZ94DRAFT_1323387 [Collybia nuda]|uniref:Uncharacterized protein n=1 Tax=Collybia nuda TaxID=64659 RepID=A0A9P5Y309_9AGAR|nr:hypothetical protein BDZ94DRAFT_1323387 [Collybia nuda]